MRKHKATVHPLSPDKTDALFRISIAVELDVLVYVQLGPSIFGQSELVRNLKAVIPVQKRQNYYRSTR